MLYFLAGSIENCKFSIAVGCNVYNVCRWVGVDAEIFGYVVFDTSWNVFLPDEELVYFSVVVDVVARAVVPVVDAIVYLDENGFVS